MTLLAAYNFDEASGAIIDHTGNGHGWTPAGGLVRTTTGGADPTGYSGRGLGTTDGSADPGPAVFGQTANRTVAFWLRSTSSFTGWIWEHHNTSGDTGRWGMLNLSNQQGFRGRNASTTAHAWQNGIADSAWHYWVGTYDGSNVRLYYGTTLGAGVSLLDTKPLTGPILTDADVIRMFTTAGSGNIVRHLRVYDEAINDIPTLNSLMAAPVGAAPDDATLTGTFSSPTVDLAANGSVSGLLSGGFSSPTVDAAEASAALGQIAGSFSAPVYDSSATASAGGALSGSFSAPTFHALGGIPLPDRDILFTVTPGTRQAFTLEVGAARTSISVGDSRTEIGVGSMDKQWRNGSEQFVDFTVGLLDPEGLLTQSEVEAFPFQVAVTTSLTTPARTDAAWHDPSVPKEVTAQTGGGFLVSIQDMYEALETGLHAVWVKFGPTPESPIYLVTTFVVL